MTQSTFKELLMSLQWLYSISAKVFSVIPWQTTATTLFTLISQITLLFAFLLPIKVVILLGADAIPAYFPDFLTLFDREYLIVALAGTSICCFLTHILCESFQGRLSVTGTAKILERTAKFEVFENQNERARRAYVQYTQGFAALVFMSLGYAALAWVYPAVALVVAGVCIAAGGLAFLRYKYEAGFANDVHVKLPSFSAIVANLIFLAVFLFLVYDYLWGDPPSILVGLVGLILVRQWVQRSTSLIAHGMGLLARRVEVSALFFRAQAADQAPAKAQTPLWQVTRSQRLERNFSDVLAQTSYEKSEVLDVDWLQTGTPGISCFVLRVASYSGEDSQLLIKIFADQRKSYADKEFSLLEIPQAQLIPAPTLVGVSSVDGLPCHIFAVSELAEVQACDQLQTITKYRCALSSVQLSPDFVSKYHRSHPGLWHRLDETMIERFSIVANSDEQRDLVEKFRAELVGLQDFLKTLPESLINAEATRQNIFTDASGQPFSINWGGWALEPLGCTWPVKFNENSRMEEYFLELKARRPALSSIPLEHLQIAAQAWEIERLYNRTLFLECWPLLRDMLELFRHRELRGPVRRQA